MKTAAIITTLNSTSPTETLESKKTFELDANTLKKNDDRIKELFKEIISAVETAGKVAKDWKTLARDFSIKTRLSTLFPHVYVEIVSHACKNIKAIDNENYKNSLNQIILSCTQAALSNFITMKNQKLEHAHKIAYQRANLLMDLKTFPAILEKLNINLIEELKKDQKIMQEENDLLMTYAIRAITEVVEPVANPNDENNVNPSAEALSSLTLRM